MHLPTSVYRSIHYVFFHPIHSTCTLTLLSISYIVFNQCFPYSSYPFLFSFSPGSLPRSLPLTTSSFSFFLCPHPFTHSSLPFLSHLLLFPFDHLRLPHFIILPLNFLFFLLLFYVSPFCPLLLPLPSLFFLPSLCVFIPSFSLPLPCNTSPFLFSSASSQRVKLEKGKECQQGR